MGQSCAIRLRGTLPRTTAPCMFGRSGLRATIRRLVRRWLTPRFRRSAARGSRRLCRTAWRWSSSLQSRRSQRWRRQRRGRADSNEGRGGFKRQRFQTSDDGTTCGHRLSKLGRLGESIVIKQDFEHLKLPLLLKPKHKEKILLAAVEVTAVRQDDIYTDELYEQEMGTQLTNIFGTMPMGKRSVGSKVMDYAQLTPEQEAELAPSWQSSFYYKIRNVRSRRGQARHSDLPHTPIPAFAPTSRSPPLAVHVRLPSQYACPPCFRNSRTRQSFTQVRCRPGCS